MLESYSVVIPAYNADATITEALKSVVEQDHPPVEVFVVDDGSTDDTAAIVKNFGRSVRLLSQPNQGCGAATNSGIEKVTTPFIAFLDSDDVWLPGKAETQLARFALSPNLSGLCTRARTFKGDLSNPQMGASFDLWSRTTLIVRSEAARKIGLMIDPPGGRGDTIDWIARGRDLGLVFEMLPEVLALRRIRPGSLSYGRDQDKDKGYLYVVKRALERKRQQELNKG